MVPEYNAPYRPLTNEADEPGTAGCSRRQESAEEVLRAPAAGRSIDAVFDLNVPGEAEKLQGHKAALGDRYHEVEPLGEGRVVLRIYPGGARRLL